MNKHGKHYYLFFGLLDLILCIGNIIFAYFYHSVFNIIVAILLGIALFMNLYGFFTAE